MSLRFNNRSFIRALFFFKSYSIHCIASAWPFKRLNGNHSDRSLKHKANSIFLSIFTHALTNTQNMHTFTQYYNLLLSFKMYILEELPHYPKNSSYLVFFNFFSYIFKSKNQISAAFLFFNLSSSKESNFCLSHFFSEEKKRKLHFFLMGKNYFPYEKKLFFIHFILYFYKELNINCFNRKKFFFFYRMLEYIFRYYFLIEKKFSNHFLTNNCCCKFFLTE